MPNGNGTGRIDASKGPSRLLPRVIAGITTLCFLGTLATFSRSMATQADMDRLEVRREKAVAQQMVSITQQLSDIKVTQNEILRLLLKGDQ